MRKRRKTAPQLLPDQLGVSKWQRDFWIALIQHAQRGKPGPPDLSGLAGFKNPAVIRHAVTTTDLWRGFDRYNAGKPYHRQVRPFGFMVMFQQKESTDSGEIPRQGKRLPKNAPTTLRVIAPFNRNPAVAARHAFDRDTGVVIPTKQLKSYARALRHYHNHPEAKFLNGERADRGPTTRRHIIARSIRHIGKEANRLDEQQVIGTDPTAQAEFGVVPENRAKRLKGVHIAVETFGPSRVAREAGMSRKYIAAVASGGASVTQTTLSNIERAISSLEITETRRSAEVEQALNWLQAECNRIGLRQVARALDISPSTLSRVIAGERQISIKLMRMINLAVVAAG